MKIDLTTGDAPASREINLFERANPQSVHRTTGNSCGPKADDNASVSSKHPLVSAGGMPPKVLVVCDHPSGSSALSKLLMDADLAVFVIDGGGQDSLELSDPWPDLVVLDLMAPGRNVPEVCRALRAIPAFANVPILFTTAPTDHLSQSACFAAGAIDFLGKPFSPEEVYARIKIHLELRQLRHAQEAKGRLERNAEDQLEQALVQAVLVVDPAGHIVFCSRTAREMLSRHLADFDPATTVITAVLDGGVFPRVAGCAELRARRFAQRSQEAGASGLAVLLLMEQTPAPNLVLSKALNLTKREADVLYWVREGKTSPEIAIILGAAHKTVKKHLQQIYSKLGVETRTAAALRASEALQRHEPANCLSEK